VGLLWLRVGQKARFTVKAFPGDTFAGTVTFISPVVDPMSRTVEVRLTAPNTEERLKPQMFVSAVAKTSVSETGKVFNRSLKGKWISPMHPEVVKDGPGTCDVCGMPLVRAESLGYVTSDMEAGEPLVIPASAPLHTGKRAIVYVEMSDDSTGTGYEGREVVLGPRVGDFYIVKSGLAEGEQVVVNGVFRIDSELQIRAKPSMMNPRGIGSTAPETPAETALMESDVPRISEKDLPPEFRERIDELLSAYIDVAEALAADDEKTAREALDRFARTYEQTTPGSGHVYSAWTTASQALDSVLQKRSKAADIEDIRHLFATISQQAILLERHYGHSGAPRHLAFCPMALDGKGGYWIQSDTVVASPYYGASMLRCGEIRETLEGNNGQ
jgi:membrane fusion protein, copper/silver efflux system